MNAGNTLTGIGQNEMSSIANRQINYYVDGALGNDSNAGTIDSPFKTIQQAIDASDESVNPGENHIHVSAGNYFEALFISDDDLLTIDGMGNNPWDVTIDSGSSGSSSMSTIGINGSTDVRLSDMWVTGDRIGIKANQVTNFELNNVVSANNSMAGMQVYNATDVKLFNSFSMGNGAEGFVGGFIENFDSQSSYFNENQYNGVDLYGVTNADFVNTRAMRNGLAENVDMGVNGIDLHDVQFLHTIAGSYSENFGSGIKGLNTTEVILDGSKATNNGADGVNVQRTLHMQSFGGNYSSNGMSGMNISDPQFAFYPAYEDPTELEVFGGSFSSNASYGLKINRMDQVHIEGVDSRSNAFDGVYTTNATTAEAFGGYYFGNGNSGLKFGGVTNVMVEGAFARENADAGLAVKGGMSVEVSGGAYRFNDKWGIHVVGAAADNFIGDVTVSNVSALNNRRGFKAEYVSNVTVNGGNYSSNIVHGLELINYLESHFNYVTATENGVSGARLNTGRFSFVEGQENVNRSFFTGGAYDRNMVDGVTVSSKYDRSFAENRLEFTGNFVSADLNGRTGLNFIDDREGNQGEAFFASKRNEANIKLNGSGMVGNDMDGVFMFAGGDEASPLTLIASIENTFSNDNGRYGLRADSHLVMDVFNSELAPEGNSWFNVDNVEFLRNGSDGAHLEFTGTYPNDQTPHFATFNEVDAHDNQGNGMTIYAALDWEQTTSISLDSKVMIQNSRFNNNVLNGLQVKAGRYNLIDLGEAATANDVEINNVTALSNDKTGLNVGSTLPERFGVTANSNVELNGGVYNNNSGDGIYVENVDNALINESEIVANGDDGVQLDFVDNFDLSTAFISGNGDNNVEVNP